jgi:hypothetical protein
LELEMKRRREVDQEFRALLQEFLDRGVFREGSPQAGVVAAVSQGGLRALDQDQMRIWNEQVLPVVSKPLHEQVAIAAILREGGYVPRRIELERYCTQL